jgi:hypothetical protein
MTASVTRRSWVFLAFWFVAVGVTAWSGTRVDAYMLHVMRVPLPHPYPWQGVLLIIGLQTIEVLVFYAIIRPESYRRSWLRTLVALLMSLALVGFFGIQLMHASAYVVWHWLWIAFSSGAFVVLLGISVTQTLRANAAQQP